VIAVALFSVGFPKQEYMWTTRARKCICKTGTIPRIYKIILQRTNRKQLVEVEQISAWTAQYWLGNSIGKAQAAWTIWTVFWNNVDGNDATPPSSQNKAKREHWNV